MSEELLCNGYTKYYDRWGDPTENLHNAYDSWLDDMSGREGAQLVPFEYDLNRHPEQSIYVPKLDALDPHPKIPDVLYYGGIHVMMARSLGALAYRRLLHQMKNQPVSSEEPSPLIERLKANHQEGRNTMVVTSHFTFPELGYVKALRFQTKKDRQRIGMGGVLLNKLMTRQSYRNKKIVDRFRSSSSIYFSCPRSVSSEKHKVPKGAMMLGNALFMKVLKQDLKKGGLELDAALTGKQIVTHRDENDRIDHYEIPSIDPASAELVKHFDDIVGVTLINSPVTGRWEMGIGELIDIQELLKNNTPAEITDSIYEEITKSVETLTGKEVDYSKLSTKLGK